MYSNYIAGLHCSLLSNQPLGFQTIASQFCAFSSRLIKATPLTWVQSDWLEYKDSNSPHTHCQVVLPASWCQPAFSSGDFLLCSSHPSFFFLLCCTGFTASTVFLFTCWTFPLDLCCYILVTPNRTCASAVLQSDLRHARLTQSHLNWQRTTADFGAYRVAWLLIVALTLLL